MVDEAEEHDPEATIWSAVSDLETKAFTRKEIVDALRRVIKSLTDDS